MDKLIDVRQMGPADEDIRRVDLLLAGAEFVPVAPAAWMASDQIRRHTAAYLQQNGVSDGDLSEADIEGSRTAFPWLQIRHAADRFPGCVAEVPPHPDGEHGDQLDQRIEKLADAAPELSARPRSGSPGCSDRDEKPVRTLRTAAQSITGALEGSNAGLSVQGDPAVACSHTLGPPSGDRSCFHRNCYACQA